MTSFRRRIVTFAGLAAFATAARSAAAGQSFVTFGDPLERAFSLDVPAGWSVRGGMFRLGYSDYRPMVALRSADGKIDIRLGDIAVPTYALPTASHGEGERDDLGAQAQLIFARYRAGRAYASLYALTRFKTSCARLTPLRSDWEPTVAGRGLAGSVAFRCDGAGGARTAYVYAKTSSQPPLWQVTSLASFLAPADRVAETEAIIRRAAATLKLQPAWIAYQKGMDARGFSYQVARQRERMAELGQQVAAFASRMRGMQDQVDAFERGQDARQTQFEAFDDAINGIAPAVDPLSGETRDVWTGAHGGYWVNGSGTVVNSSGSPGSGYHQLQPP